MGERPWTPPPRSNQNRPETKELDDGGGPRPEAVPSGSLGFMARRLARFPRLKRQLHPLLAHFPITFMLSATFFSLFYLLTGVACFKTTAFHCLAGGLLFLPPAIWTGLLTEKINYPDSPPSTRIEKIISAMLSLVGFTVLIWSLVNPDVLDNLHGLNLIYLFLILALALLVVAAGYFGDMLTFPLEDERHPDAGAGTLRKPKP